MIFQVHSNAARRQVATIEAMDLDCAAANAKRQARLFNRDPDDLIIIRDLDPQPHAERDRYGFAWLDGGAGERPMNSTKGNHDNV
jgi:hypothetical protein